MKLTLKITAITLGLTLANCGKDSKSEDKESGDKLEITENLENPSKLLDTALAAMGSAMDTELSTTMVSSLALPLLGDGLTIDDCDEHAEPLARAGDDEEYTDSTKRLRLHHPRMPLQDYYCKMQKDTGAPDSFLGALSGGKTLFCIMGDSVKFDGKERIVTVTKEEFIACLPEGSTEEDKNEMTEGMGDEVSATVKAVSPPEFGDPESWDGSITFAIKLGDMDETLKLLVKDSDDVLALANLSSSGRAKPVDAYVVAINKTTGEVRYEAKFQRILTLDGTSSNGWNRHARAYVKGTFDDDLIFTSVETAEGAYSDISVNGPNDDNPENSDAPLTSGSAWTVKGTATGGFKSHSYSLDCDWDQNTEESVCVDNANLVSSWLATDGSGACNGVLSGTTCTTSGIELKNSSQTSFFMDIDHEEFETTQTWFQDLAIPTFDAIELTITQ